MNETMHEFFVTQLRRLDILLHREILRLRATYQLSLDEFRGLYVSDQQVDALINSQQSDVDIEYVSALTAEAQALAIEAALLAPQCMSWQHVVDEFGLSVVEQDILLLALAPEFDLKYETLYAYLNNDITRKWPTRDLALRLLASDSTQKLRVRQHLSLESTLFSEGLLNTIQAASQRPSWLADGYFVSPAASSFLLDVPYRDPRLAGFVEQCEPSMPWDKVPLTEDKRSGLRRIVNLFKPPLSGGTAPLLVFEGRYGAGTWEAAEALCFDLSVPLLRVDMEAARASGEPLRKLAQALTLQRRLNPSGIYLDACASLFDKEGRPSPDAYGFLVQLSSTPRKGSKHALPFKRERSDADECSKASPIFLAFEPGNSWRELTKAQRVVSFKFDDPDYTTRLSLWMTSLAERGASICESDVKALADRFVLTPGQIRDAVTAVLDAQRLSKEQPTHALESQILFGAARAQSDQNLGTLAVKVNTVHTWEDLILPRSTRSRVKEVTAAIKYRHVVYSEWGFERRITLGKGLKVLFAGASGTGKTMTAGVIARDLGLDLYKIDLSAVVSKYIGETEKNLDRIFRAAQCSNAILFFDEADALFGKRSETKDAHDRYANIEVAYLLQKIEEYEGVVILASNLSKNIDEAFSRRMHYVVEFPLPDESHRERLWRGMFPSEVPLGEDVNFQFLAKQFQLAGGDIRNVALDAAFLAAQDGKIITMKQLVTAMSRQMMKQGQIPSPTDFKQYHELISQGE